MNGEQYVICGKGDLYQPGNKDEDSLCKVFINGMLQHPWNYTDVIFQMDRSKSKGIRFKDGIVNPGDTVTVMYLCDRNYVIGDFPIDEEYHYDVFEGNFTKDYRDWSKRENNKHRFMLNNSLLNKSMLVTPDHDRNFSTEIDNKDKTNFKKLDEVLDIKLNGSCLS